MAAADRTTPAIRLRFVANTSTLTVYVTSYSGRESSDSRYAPLVTTTASTITIALAEATNAAGFDVDVASGVSYDWIAFAVDVTTGQRKPITVASDRYTLSFATAGAGTAHTYDLTLYGSYSTANMGDYGGDVAKRDSITEGADTFAHQWYRMLLSAEGSAYSTSDSSIRSYELKAHARALGTAQRLSEMLAASSNPGTSDALLYRWVKWLKVQTANIPTWRVRYLCELRCGDTEAPDDDYISAGVSEILGPVFNSILTNLGTLDSPPTGTHSVDTTPGDTLFDVAGTGTWRSPRANITILVNQGSLSDEDLVSLMSGEVAIWLDNNLPSSKTWDWSVSTLGAFTLGTSKLGMAAL